MQKCLILLAFVSYEAVRLWWWGGNCGVVGFGKTPCSCSIPTLASIHLPLIPEGGVLPNPSRTAPKPPLCINLCTKNRTLAETGLTRFKPVRIRFGVELPRFIMRGVKKERYRLVQLGNRKGMVYCKDTLTGSRTSLRTKDRAEAERLVRHKIEAIKNLGQRCAGGIPQSRTEPSTSSEIKSWSQRPRTISTRC